MKICEVCGAVESYEDETGMEAEGTETAEGMGEAILGLCERCRNDFANVN